MSCIWNLNKHYDRKEAFTSADYMETTYNKHGDNNLTFQNLATVLKSEDTVYYWLLVAIRIGPLKFDKVRHALFDLSFTVRKNDKGELYISNYHDEYDIECKV